MVWLEYDPFYLLPRYNMSLLRRLNCISSWFSAIYSHKPSTFSPSGIFSHDTPTSFWWDVLTADTGEDELPNASVPSGKAVMLSVFGDTVSIVTPRKGYRCMYDIQLDYIKFATRRLPLDTSWPLGPLISIDHHNG